MEVLALIPARSGSKGLPHKNIRPFLGKPLLAHSVEQARQSGSVTRVIVSTDEPKYAEVARDHGAETPFLRPATISADLSTDFEVFEHALSWLAENEGYKPDICVHLRPTYPTRRVEDIDAAVSLLRAAPDCDSVRSVVPAAVSPYKMWFLSGDGSMHPAAVDPDLPDACSLPRQALRAAYLQNACVDAFWSRVIAESRTMTGRRVRPLLMSESSDIDELWEFEQAEATAVAGAAAGPRVFVIDIDGVLAALTPDNEYSNATALQENIDAVNALYLRGNRIVLFTARGSATGRDWRGVTERQMETWGVRFHELIFGKPAADYYVDDRMLTMDALRKLARA